MNYFQYSSVPSYTSENVIIFSASLKTVLILFMFLPTTSNHGNRLDSNQHGNIFKSNEPTLILRMITLNQDFIPYPHQYKFFPPAALPDLKPTFH